MEKLLKIDLHRFSRKAQKRQAWVLVCIHQTMYDVNTATSCNHAVIMRWQKKSQLVFSPHPVGRAPNWMSYRHARMHVSMAMVSWIEVWLLFFATSTSSCDSYFLHIIWRVTFIFCSITQYMPFPSQSILITLYRINCPCTTLSYHKLTWHFPTKTGMAALSLLWIPMTKLILEFLTFCYHIIVYCVV